MLYISLDFFFRSPLQASLSIYKNAAKIREIEKKAARPSHARQYKKRSTRDNNNHINFRKHPSHQNVSEEDICVKGIMKNV